MIHFQNLFIAPTFDELEEVATDRNGALKKLTDSQLQSIWKNGYEYDQFKKTLACLD